MLYDNIIVFLWKCVYNIIIHITKLATLHDVYKYVNFIWRVLSKQQVNTSTTLICQTTWVVLLLGNLSKSESCAYKFNNAHEFAFIHNLFNQKYICDLNTFIVFNSDKYDDDLNDRDDSKR